MDFNHFLTSYMPDPTVGSKKHFQNMIDQAVLAEKLDYLSVYIPDLSMVVLFNLGVFAGGLIWAGLYQKFSNFWAIWLSHLIVDVGIMVIVYKILFLSA